MTGRPIKAHLTLYMTSCFEQLGTSLIFILYIFSTKEVFKECMASCWPNPCQNGAECVEKWGAHQCICVNQWAHSGHNCEIGRSAILLFKECMASCWPNPCQNGAECVEKWGAHQCICVNQWAHSGHNCEIGRSALLLFKE